MISVVLGLFIVGLCWRTFQLTLRIENLERALGLRRGPVKFAPDDVVRKADGSASLKVL